MTHKYQYTGLQGAMKAQWMLAMFPELEFTVLCRNELCEILQINVEANVVHHQNDVIMLVAISCPKNIGQLHKIVFKNNDVDQIKIIVPPEMEGFFDVRVGDIVKFEGVTAKVWGELRVKNFESGTNVYIGREYFEQTVDFLIDSGRLSTLKRRGIDFHMPERAAE